MARIRSVKPELPQDAKLAKVSREARLTFIYLLTQADDQGYFRASPRLLLGQLYPHDADVTEPMLMGWMNELCASGLLAAFDSEDGPLGHIVNFLKHQKIDHPSKVFLAQLSRKPREDFAKGVLSLESRVLSLDHTASSSRAREPSASEQRVRDTLPSDTRSAFDGLMRAARNPEAAAMAVEAMHRERGPNRPAYPWEVVGEALRDIAAAGDAFSARRLEVFCREIEHRGNGKALPEKPARGQDAKNAAIEEGVRAVFDQLEARHAEP